MLLIPAIDLKDGKCVRLRQGRMEDDTVCSDDPLAVADRWVAAGARRLHIVDLNGAFTGKPVNADAIRRIAEAHPAVPIQVGGGIRDDETLELYLAMGVNYVILGTNAVNVPHFVGDACSEFPGHIMVGLDARDGKVAIDGWSKLSNHDVIDIAQRFEREDVDATVALARAITIPVIASGGVSCLDDIRKLCEVTGEGVMGAVIGRALYEGGLDLAEAQKLADQLGQ